MRLQAQFYGNNNMNKIKN